MKRYVTLAVTTIGICFAGNLTSCTKIASELPAPITALTTKFQLYDYSNLTINYSN